MIKRRNLLALLLAAVMGASLLTGCSGKPAEPAAQPAQEEAEEAAPEETAEAAEEAAPEEAAAEKKASADTPLVVGYAPFSSKFSPFFAETAYDQDAQSLTQISLLSMDRMGAVIYKGIEGETIE